MREIASWEKKESLLLSFLMKDTSDSYMADVTPDKVRDTNTRVDASGTPDQMGVTFA